MPSFLQRGITPTQALELDRFIDPFGRALELSLSNSDKSNFWRITHEPKAGKAGRRNFLRDLTKLADALKPAQERLRSVLDTTAPAQALHIPLIAFIANKFNYTDAALPRELTQGVKITGTIAKSNALATRISLASKNLQTLRGGLRRRDRNIIRAIKSTSNWTLKQK